MIFHPILEKFHLIILLEDINLTEIFFENFLYIHHKTFIFSHSIYLFSTILQKTFIIWL
ncbi:hypothetical protein XBKB1_3150002 [Xenorhabdus bovienii str. kraussei Becker Underwood]|uniref:Uncharacterized protein n=1 Tax=Xenorhabdus bovienii str. kraussei Becker Underwood TaxID=1398204 RepID=A0A077PUX0_XENBV|nr:hypothetical protein XBKB1_3150002 [Xenorhabdus bovienii str. kraussei Becker Underwood]